jgi:hypothetical protein
MGWHQSACGERLDERAFKVGPRIGGIAFPRFVLLQAACIRQPMSALDSGNPTDGGTRSLQDVLPLSITPRDESGSKMHVHL